MTNFEKLLKKFNGDTQEVSNFIYTASVVEIANALGYESDLIPYFDCIVEDVKADIIRHRIVQNELMGQFDGIVLEDLR